MKNNKAKFKTLRGNIYSYCIKRRSIVSLMILVGIMIISFSSATHLKNFITGQKDRIAELEQQNEELQAQLDFKSTEMQAYIDLYNDNESTIITMKEEKDEVDTELASAKDELSMAKKTISASKVYSTESLSRGEISEKSLKNYEILSVDEMNDFINRRAPSDSPFIGQGEIFLKAAKESGLDPKYIAAIAGLESSWGRSTIAQNKNNYFGITAYNTNPYDSAKSFDSLEDGIIQGAVWIKNNFTDKGKDNLQSMIYGGSAYCQTDSGEPSQSWIDNITSIIK